MKVQFCLQVVLYSFLTEIYAMWLACGQYPELVVEDVKDEIFDIVKPASPLHISLTDLLVSYLLSLKNPVCWVTIQDTGISEMCFLLMFSSVSNSFQLGS
jgi:hypothetical protein